MKPRLDAMRGFTLIEVAIVFLIVSMLLGAGLTMFSAQMETQKVNDTQKELDEAREALLAFAAAYGRLPCPATALSNGVESPVGGGACTAPVYTGFLPAATLGLVGASNGYLLDPWSNRIQYAVTTANANAATTAGRIRTVTMATFGPQANLVICNTASGITVAACSGLLTTVTNNAVAVVFSRGRAPGAAAGIDEAANLNNDPVFVWHPPADVAAPNGEFAGMFTWISPPVLFNKMIQGGSLP